tara:strand:+ start:201 stop:707 length:507 start_codon:yes stop_codon:yes gene_type:complete
MRILTLGNESYNLNNLPEELEEDLRFSVLDNSDINNPDFFFIPLIFLESFSSPAVVMEINGNEVMMPVDWNLAVGDSQTGNDLEILPLTSLNDRGFEAFLFNPLKSYQANYAEVKIVNFYNDVKWYFPKMKNGQLLSVPISEGDNPMCAFFVKDISRQLETIDFGKLL